MPVSPLEFFCIAVHFPAQSQTLESIEGHRHHVEPVSARFLVNSSTSNELKSATPKAFGVCRIAWLGLGHILALETWNLGAIDLNDATRVRAVAEPDNKYATGFIRSGRLFHGVDVMPVLVEYRFLCAASAHLMYPARLVVGRT